MLKKLIVTAAVLAIVTAANATISADWGLYTSTTLTDGTAVDVYRITVDVSDTAGMGADDWTAAGLELGLVGGTYYQDAFGGNPPNPAFFPAFPDVEWDTYYTSPATYPNTTYDAAAVGVASTHDTASMLDTDWFDTIDTGNGHFVLQQFTVVADADYSLSGVLQYAARNSGGTLFEMVIPEPGTLALLALGGLALIRRR